MDTPVPWYQIVVMFAGWLFGWYLAFRPRQYHETAALFLRSRSLRAFLTPIVIQAGGVFFIIVNTLLIVVSLASHFR
jgi:hypothetical protein